jgi:hypothetical protein
MRVSPHKFLAVLLAACPAVVFLRCPTGPDEPPGTGSGKAVQPGEQFEAVDVRSLARTRLALEAATGRRSLLEAAALYRQLNRLPPRASPPRFVDRGDPRADLPLGSEEALLCRQVVIYADAALREERRDREAEAAVTRLGAEFYAELRARGTVRLPEPATLGPIHELLEQARARLAEQQRGGRDPRPGPATR